MPSKESKETRRHFLTTGASLGATLAVTGCSGFLESGVDESNSDDASTETGTPTESGSDEAILADVSGEYTLQEGEGTAPTGDLAKPLTFQGSEGETVTMTMASSQLNSSLVLEGPDGTVVEESGDNGKNTNSRLQTTLEAGGEYTVWCASVFGSTGAFDFTLRRGSPPLSGQGSPQQISYGENEQYTLQEGDGSDPKYFELALPVTFEGSSGERVTIEMTSGDIDPYLLLTGPDGSVVTENDNGGFGFDSSIETTLSADGQYTIWCGSYDGDETGQFTLSLSQDGSSSTGTDPGQISYGESRTFLLEDGDGRDPRRDALAKPIRFDGTSGDTAVINMTSGGIDAFLILEGPNETVVAQDDDGGSGLNSQISITLSQTGAYTIWCGSFSGSDTGEFTLSLDTESTSGSRQ